MKIRITPLLGFVAVTLAILLLSSCGLQPAWTRPANENRATVSLPRAVAAVQIPEDQVQQTFFVDNQSPAASDQNPGTEALPFQTISRGAQVAQSNNEQRIGTKIYVKPGVYREQVTLSQSRQETDAPIIFEGTVPGNVILSGSDIWGNWQLTGERLYQHAWPYRWGLAPYPRGWAGNVTLAPIVRRREMVFINGHALAQVLNFSDITDYSFYADEDHGLIYVKSGPVLPLDDSTEIEVATRPSVFSMAGKSNVVLRNLEFRHGNAAVQDAAVQISNSTNILIESCLFRWNNWIGLGISQIANLTLRKNVSVWNGATGFDGYNLKNIVLDSNDTSFNNWRGAAGDFYGWSVAGAKLGGVHMGSIVHHRSVGNRARGIWLDYDNSNLTVDDATLLWNFKDGIFIEASAGPTLIQNSNVTDNQNAGVAGANASDVTLLGNTLMGNTGEQILITGDYDRTVTNWETGVQQDIQAARWTIRSNTIVSRYDWQAVFQTPLWQPFLTSLLAGSNTWSRPGDPRAFHIDTNWFTFQQWQSLVHTDNTSVFQE
jgi:parallel beta-helix repeat protein